MASREIWHEILIHASPADLYQAVTDVKKLGHWWTTDTRGESTVGKNLEFWFGGLCQPMEVTTLKDSELVRWNVKQGGAPDWTDTRIEFKIFRDRDQTFLHFRHSNWREDAKAFPHCSLGWAIFLLSLKEFVETGKGRPYPYDMPVNMWTPPQTTTANC
jgi:uncharacterized protein YndB with AHSA1/START domain